MTLLRLLLPALCFLPLAGPALGQSADELHQKQARAAIAQRLATEEAACYQQFAVNDCLRRARQKARTAQAHEQQQSSARKQAERLERSIQHQQELQEKQASVRAQATPQVADVQARGARKQRPSQSTPHARGGDAEKALAERAAQQRARGEQAAKARQRLLDKQRQAAERQQARSRRQAQQGAQGHPSVAPLPDPS